MKIFFITQNNHIFIEGTGNIYVPKSLGLAVFDGRCQIWSLDGTLIIASAKWQDIRTQEGAGFNTLEEAVNYVQGVLDTPPIEKDIILDGGKF